MKDLMKRVAPSRFADIVALVALFRPGPLQLADDFIRRKHGLDEVDYFTHRCSTYWLTPTV